MVGYIAMVVVGCNLFPVVRSQSIHVKSQAVRAITDYAGGLTHFWHAIFNVDILIIMYLLSVTL